MLTRAEHASRSLPGPAGKGRVFSLDLARAGFESATPDDLAPADIRVKLAANDQNLIPRLARDLEEVRRIEEGLRRLPTRHVLHCGDARDMSAVPDESVHLAVTSPPYWTLKEYPERKGQLGAVAGYEEFLGELDKVWAQVLRVLVPGGRLVVVVGDVCLPRRVFGRHVVYPLHAAIQERCRRIGFDNLAPIIWHKIANATLEAGGSSRFLGKPYEPNSILKNDIEFILFQRKPGGYRKPTPAMRYLSVLPQKLHAEWFQQIWTVAGSSTRLHPAPFSVHLAERLIRMFSFAGDTVLDPFMGTGSVAEAAALWGRNSLGFEIEPAYFALAVKRLKKLYAERFQHGSLL